MENEPGNEKCIGKERQTDRITVVFFLRPHPVSYLAFTSAMKNLCANTGILGFGLSASELEKGATNIQHIYVA